MAVSLNTNALLASMAELNSFTALALTDSDTANTLINSASDFIERHTKRVLKSATYTSEKYDGNGSYYLYLRQWPITAISSVKRWDTVSNASAATYVENTDYLYDGTKGWLYLREGFQIGVQNYQVTYTGGYTIIPYDVRQACAMYAEWQYTMRGKTGLSSERIGDYSYQLKDPSRSAGIGGITVPNEILSLLAKYVKADIV